MTEKIELSKEELNEIIKLYTQNNLPLRKIGKLVGNKSQTFITKILITNGVYKFKNGENVEKHDTLIESENITFIAVCKFSGIEFNDYKNSSGILTEHLRNNYPEIKHPSNFQKRDYKSKNGKYWHEQYFDIIKKEIIKKEVKKCAYCDWETIDLLNKSGQYTVHLLSEHKVTLEQYVAQFPKEKHLFQTFSKNKERIDIMLSDNDNYVICKICNKKVKSLTNTHLKRHNITLYDYKEKFPKEKYHSKKFVDETSLNLKNASLKIEKSYVSKPEKSLKEFLESININFDSNNRKFLNGIEIDIINHDKKIGIEFNGNLYHSENYGGKSKNFHLNKTELMNKKEYGLIHIFEDEWHLKNDIVKNKLKHLFNVSENLSIYARNCILKEIPSDLKNIFLNNYHIQGEDRSNISIGAYYNDKLVSVMTFDNNRQMNKKENNKNEYELKRFCSTNDYLVIGIAGKLLSYFIKKYNPKKIISFADRRWTLDSENNLYTKLGFKLASILSPDYTYYNNKIHRVKRHHKFSFGKSSLKKKFSEVYNENKTEWEMMQELGYDRIWDCGKFKYELSF